MIRTEQLRSGSPILNKIIYRTLYHIHRINFSLFDLPSKMAHKNTFI